MATARVQKTISIPAGDDGVLERAARLGGYGSVHEFMRLAVLERARQILADKPDERKAAA